VRLLLNTLTDNTVAYVGAAKISPHPFSSLVIGQVQLQKKTLIGYCTNLERDFKSPLGALTPEILWS